MIFHDEPHPSLSLLKQWQDLIASASECAQDQHRNTMCLPSLCAGRLTSGSKSLLSSLLWKNTMQSNIWRSEWCWSWPLPGQDSMYPQTTSTSRQRRYRILLILRAVSVCLEARQPSRLLCWQSASTSSSYDSKISVTHALMDGQLQRKIVVTS